MIPKPGGDVSCTTEPVPDSGIQALWPLCEWASDAVLGEIYPQAVLWLLCPLDTALSRVSGRVSETLKLAKWVELVRGSGGLGAKAPLLCATTADLAPQPARHGRTRWLPVGLGEDSRRAVCRGDTLFLLGVRRGQCTRWDALPLFYQHRTSWRSPPGRGRSRAYRE